MTLEAARQVGRPIFFAMVIIILAFVPVFALTGQEGKLFHPLAFTKTFAMAGATMLAVTLVPALCAALIRGPFQAEGKNLLMRLLLSIYDPVLNWGLCSPQDRSWPGADGALGGFGAGVGPAVAQRHSIFLHCPPRAAKVARGMGSEFMPTFNEGSLLFMPVLLPSTSRSPRSSGSLPGRTR